MKLNAYQLKWIAIVGMVLFHAMYAFETVLSLPVMVVMGAAGGLTFPIMGYFITEGYRHTSNIKRYLLRLFIFGLIAIPFHVLVMGGSLRFNIMFTIILSIIALVLHDKIKRKVLFWILVFPVVLVLSVILMMDWLIIGTIVVMLYHLIKNETLRRVLPPIVAGSFWFSFTAISRWGISQLESIGGQYETIQMILDAWGGNMYTLIATQAMVIGCLCAAFLLKNYNGERGKKMKWLFYTVYPLHLAVIAAGALALGLIVL